MILLYEALQPLQVTSASCRACLTLALEGLSCMNSRLSIDDTLKIIMPEVFNPRPSVKSMQKPFPDAITKRFGDLDTF